MVSIIKGNVGLRMNIVRMDVMIGRNIGLRGQARTGKGRKSPTMDRKENGIVNFRGKSKVVDRKALPFEEDA